MLSSVTIPAFAAEDGKGVLISVSEYTDESGNHITERIYRKADETSENGGISPVDESHISDNGSYTYRKERKLGEDACIYVEARFVWDGTNVTVSNERGGFEGLAERTEVYHENVTTGTGGVFTKNAYAKYTARTKNIMQIVQDHSIKLTVDANGNAS